ncbi:hypothetical protein D3C80_1331520 [compost metagenome]
MKPPGIEGGNRQDRHHARQEERQQRFVPAFGARLNPAARTVDHRVDPGEHQGRDPETQHQHAEEYPPGPPGEGAGGQEDQAQQRHRQADRIGDDHARRHRARVTGLFGVCHAAYPL